jgi:hypothetical protein
MGISASPPLKWGWKSSYRWRASFYRRQRSYWIVTSYLCHTAHCESIHSDSGHGASINWKVMMDKSNALRREPKIDGAASCEEKAIDFL